MIGKEHMYLLGIYTCMWLMDVLITIIVIYDEVTTLASKAGSSNFALQGRADLALRSLHLRYDRGVCVSFGYRYKSHNCSKTKRNSYTFNFTSVVLLSM